MSKKIQNGEQTISFSNNETQIYTPEELAKKIKISSRTLLNLRMNGAGPRFFKGANGCGGKILYDWQDVLVYLESRKRNSTSDTGSNR